MLLDKIFYSNPFLNNYYIERKRFPEYYYASISLRALRVSLIKMKFFAHQFAYTKKLWT